MDARVHDGVGNARKGSCSLVSAGPGPAVTRQVPDFSDSFNLTITPFQKFRTTRKRAKTGVNNAVVFVAFAEENLAPA